MVETLISPKHKTYEVIIIGGAIYGSSIAWFLSDDENFNGNILVVERDPSYEFSSTARTNSCIRQQFSTKINIEISQYGASYIKRFRKNLHDDPRVPNLSFQSFGYLYLSNNEHFSKFLKQRQEHQSELGAHTKFLLSEEISKIYPFYNLDDILAGTHNKIDEGYFDGATMFEWWQRCAKENGVEFIKNEVTALKLNSYKNQIDEITLKSNDRISTQMVINASGTRAANISRMIGIEIPVEPRKRYSYVFKAEKPLDQLLPLTIDPSGVHMRSDGLNYLAGCPPNLDPGVDFDDFEVDHSLWEEKVWPCLAHRVPAFEAIKLLNFWVGHYAFNFFDQNAIVGRHPLISNFIFSNGFSGHGLQQSPAIGRGVAELLVYGKYRSIDLSPLSFTRILENKPLKENAII